MTRHQTHNNDLQANIDPSINLVIKLNDDLNHHYAPVENILRECNDLDLTSSELGPATEAILQCMHHCSSALRALETHTISGILGRVLVGRRVWVQVTVKRTLTSEDLQRAVPDEREHISLDKRAAGLTLIDHRTPAQNEWFMPISTSDLTVDIFDDLCAKVAAVTDVTVVDKKMSRGFAYIVITVSANDVKQKLDDVCQLSPYYILGVQSNAPGSVKQL